MIIFPEKYLQFLFSLVEISKCCLYLNIYNQTHIFLYRLFLPFSNKYYLRRTIKMRRTTHRSRAGKKLYAVRDSKGRFKDIQTYKRAHSMDIKRKSKAEIAAANR
jgi:hypothetical protein